MEAQQAPAELLWQTPRTAALRLRASVRRAADVAAASDDVAAVPRSLAVSYDRAPRGAWRADAAPAALRGTAALATRVTVAAQTQSDDVAAAAAAQSAARGRTPGGARAAAAAGAARDAADAAALARAWQRVGELRVAFDAAGADVYGGGEVPGALRLTGRTVEAWCSDTPFYDETFTTLYQAHMWVLVLLGDGSACGVLVDTTYRCEIDASRVRADGAVAFRVPLGADELLFPEHVARWSVNVYQLFGAHPIDVAKALAKLTGRMPMPPRWALGFQMCRWSYHPAARALEVAKEFRERRIPCDVMWFDIHYMDRYRIFTFNPDEFPDPRATMESLHELGFRGVWMIDPGVADERKPRKNSVADEPATDFIKDIALHAEELREDEKASAGDSASGAAAPAAPAPAANADDAADGFDKTALTRGVFESGNAVPNGWVQQSQSDSAPLVAKVWPGACVFPDFTNEAMADWWAEQYKPFLALGIDGVWNDMNEPAVFDTSSKTLPLTAWHPGAQAPHSAVHNQYGMLMAQASRRGIQMAMPERRPFLLTRAGGVGTQRFAAVWTGDNSSDARHMRYSIAMALQLGLSGQPFVGPDIGGFFGDAHAKLYARWIGIGTLLPLARAHTAEGTLPHEPWAFGDECEATCRVAISRRYRLLPFLYTLFRRSHQTGVPVVRPLFYAAPRDQSLRDEDSGFLIGDDLLVATPPRFFADALLPADERDKIEREAREAREKAHAEGTVPISPFGDNGAEPLSRDPLAPLRLVPPAIDRDSMRDADGTPLPAGAQNWLLLDDILHDGIDIDGACLEDLPHVYVRRGSCVPLGMVVPSVAYLSPDEVVVDVVVALAARPGAEAVGVVYEDDGDGYEHQRSGRYRETTYFAQVQDTVERVVVQRRVTGGGADYGRFAQVRILCCVGNGPVAIGIINPGDDTLHMLLPGLEDDASDDGVPPIDIEDGSYEDLDVSSPRDTWTDENDGSEGSSSDELIGQAEEHE